MALGGGGRLNFPLNFLILIDFKLKLYKYEKKCTKPLVKVAVNFLFCKIEISYFYKFLPKTNFSCKFRGNYIDLMYLVKLR